MDLAQLVFPGFWFGKDDPRKAERLSRMGVGGFCLYGGKPAQIANFVRKLQKCAKTPLLFCGDYEDGIASQVEGGTRFPSALGLGASRRPDLAFEKGRITAIESRAIGVRWVFAPVLDLATRANNPIVNTRSFGADPDRVAALGKAYLKGLRKGAVLSCVKHFPGHGDTAKDSHLSLPTLKVSRRQLLGRELKPFAQCAASADAVMIGHLVVPALKDRKGLPASLSRNAITGLLRKELRFDSLVVTDALLMGAITRHYGEGRAALLAFAAGADLLLVPAKPLELLRRLPEKVLADQDLVRRADAALRRLREAKRRCGLFADRGIPQPNALSLVGLPRHQRAAAKMAQASLAWLRRRPDVPPIPLSAAYYEPENPDPKKWRGKAFLAGLKRYNVGVRPFKRGWKGAVIVGIFVGPRAFSGRIKLSPREASRANAALKSGNPRIAVSFGSPFALKQIQRADSALAAFSDCEASQAAAARVLAAGDRASGRIPVEL